MRSTPQLFDVGTERLIDCPEELLVCSHGAREKGDCLPPTTPHSAFPRMDNTPKCTYMLSEGITQNQIKDTYEVY